MKLVVNKCYGGYSVPSAVADAIGCDAWDDSIEVRTNPVFINYVGNGYSGLKVVEIPDNMEFEIEDYDGFETVIYSEKPIFRV